MPTVLERDQVKGGLLGGILARIEGGGGVLVE